ncbi:hypothetical protein Clacol_000936 [Clathrus columnatus]|uniref:Uncharacterized protein n=1 Tax=Clathrus columnatus TaxID=1419009 RepID=A0AAV5A166_9AGAM|nr:hypothetical protein Clacol_000936 [Clathrus columnatus]
MSCTTPKVPTSNITEVSQFNSKFGDQTRNFIEALKLPSALDPSVLSYKTRSGTYYVNELEDPNIVRSFIQYYVDDAIEGPFITLDTAPIIDNMTKFIHGLVGVAKNLSTFSGSSSTSYRGTFFGSDSVFKAIIAVYIADVSNLYDNKPGSVVQLAYHAFLTAQKAN